MTDQMGLFPSSSFGHPLAYRLRPKNFDSFVGQKQALDFIKKFNPDTSPHLILWGPPGTGKTTLANLLATEFNKDFYPFNAVMSGVPELRKVIAQIKENKDTFAKQALLFIDEIHRFNKAQQDALLPHLERGDFLLIGATTEYPQTSLNRALLSRVRTIELKKLSTDNIENILTNAVNKEKKALPTWIQEKISQYSNGDARSALNYLEILWEGKKDLENITQEELKEILSQNSRHYDKNSDRHYDVISAFIKSVRGSDANAAILWLAVMLDGGEDPMFVARRLVVLASEDIGNANPQGLILANSCLQSVKEIGMPEARIILAQTTTYLAASPKSNASYLAIDKALAHVKDNPTIEVPTHLRNHHPDKQNYKYPHSYANHWVKQDYKSDGTPNDFYQPTELGSEKKIKEILDGYSKN